MDTILVVDDERLFLSLVRDELEKAGFAVVTAENATDALDALATKPVRAAIMDVVMPGTDGMELLPRIHKEHPSLPIIVVSGRASFLTGVHAMRLGAVDFLRKPLNFEELVRTVRSAIAQGKTEGEARPVQLPSLDRLQRGALALSDTIQWGALGAFAKDQRAFFQRVVDVVAEVLGVEVVSVMLVQESDGTLRIVHATGLEAEVQRQAAPRVGEGIAGGVAKSGEPLLVKDIGRDPRFAGRKRHPRYRTDSLLCVPLKVNGKIVGVVNANNKSSGEPFDEQDLAILTALACLASLGVAATQLFEQLTASVDELAATNARLARVNSELEARVKELHQLRGKSR
jgi:DNA-binding response OmpR family regulator